MKNYLWKNFIVFICIVSTLFLQGFTCYACTSVAGISGDFAAEASDYSGDISGRNMFTVPEYEDSSAPESSSLEADGAETESTAAEADKVEIDNASAKEDSAEIENTATEAEKAESENISAKEDDAQIENNDAEADQAETENTDVKADGEETVNIPSAADTVDDENAELPQNDVDDTSDPDKIAGEETSSAAEQTISDGNAQTDSLEEEVISVEFPTLGESGVQPFDFILDPQRLITATDGVKYGNITFEEGSTLYFRNMEGSYDYSSRSDHLMITNRSTVPVAVTLTACLQNYEGISLTNDPTFKGDNRDSIYLALVDDNGWVVPLSESGEVKIIYEMREISGNESMGGTVAERYSFGLVGACNPNGSWEYLAELPQVVVTWKVTPILDDETVVSDNTISDNSILDNCVSDNNVSDNSISDNSISMNVISDNSLSFNVVSDNNMPDQSVSSNLISGNSISDNAISGNGISQNGIALPSGDTVVNDLVQGGSEAGSQGAVDKASDNTVSENNVSANEISGNNVSENNVSGNEISGNNVSGNNVSGNEVSGNNVSENNVSGNEISGNNVSENNVSGNEVSGNNVSGNNVSGNEVSGNNVSDNNVSYSSIIENNISDNNAPDINVSGNQGASLSVNTPDISAEHQALLYNSSYDLDESILSSAYLTETEDDSVSVNIDVPETLSEADKDAPSETDASETASVTDKDVLSETDALGTLSEEDESVSLSDTSVTAGSSMADQSPIEAYGQIECSASGQTVLENIAMENVESVTYLS